MTRTTHELAPPLQSSAPHQRKDVWPGFNMHQAQLYVGSLVESGFEPRTHRLRIETLPLGHHGQVLWGRSNITRLEDDPPINEQFLDEVADWFKIMKFKAP
ncbi:hypothetical protein AVEN_188582-1 [Araneus ventricosus]|uniref:Uncharacterized protein n=1 Tax=Araneus ventricosus TaxID=182803 RepID=A0A4Y2HR47_ARAVE|nr:hypothetical protein AVEN_188582-1 [Araneus ventricosus]